MRHVFEAKHVNEIEDACDNDCPRDRLWIDAIRKPLLGKENHMNLGSMRSEKLGMCYDRIL